LDRGLSYGSRFIAFTRKKPEAVLSTRPNPRILLELIEASLQDSSVNAILAGGNRERHRIEGLIC
jgi:hypothetical protein